MADTKRVPTEMEAKLLLREVGRRMEDEQAIGDYSELSRRRWRSPGSMVALVLVMLPCGIALAFLERRGEPVGIWAALLCLAILTLMQGFEIGRLIKVTAALARMSERSRAAETLPRAPESGRQRESVPPPPPPAS